MLQRLIDVAGVVRGVGLGRGDGTLDSGRRVTPTREGVSEPGLLVSSQATTSLVCSSTARWQLAGVPGFRGGVRHWPTCTERPLLSMRRVDGLHGSPLVGSTLPPASAWRLEIVLWSGTSLSRFRSVSSERRKPAVCLDARPHTKPKVTVVSMAWFEYWRCRPGFLRVGLGEFQLASLPSVSPEPDGQTPASAETRLVLPPIPDTVGLLDVLPLGALETRHAGPRISGWRAIIDRDRELCTKATL